MSRPLSEIFATLQEGVAAFRKYEEKHRANGAARRGEGRRISLIKAEANAAMAQKLEGAIGEVRERLEAIRDLPAALEMVERGIGEYARQTMDTNPEMAGGLRGIEHARALLAKVEKGR